MCQFNDPQLGVLVPFHLLQSCYLQRHPINRLKWHWVHKSGWNIGQDERKKEGNPANNQSFRDDGVVDGMSISISVYHGDRLSRTPVRGHCQGRRGQTDMIVILNSWNRKYSIVTWFGDWIQWRSKTTASKTWTDEASSLWSDPSCFEDQLDWSYAV